MSRIKSCFDLLLKDGRKGLIPFIVAGDPEPKFTLPVMHEMVKAGADIIELGFPFSDPIADGKAIQQASERALLHGISLTDVIDMVALFRKDNQETPIVLMGYLNPIESMGYEKFSMAAKMAGVDGLLIVDMPLEEAVKFSEILSQSDIDLICLMSPTTREERQKSILEAASGFLYYVSLKGVTGSDKIDVGAVQDCVSKIKCHSRLPVSVGFGIRDPKIAADITRFSDAVVIGSAITELMGRPAQTCSDTVVTVGGYLQGIRNSIDSI